MLEKGKITILLLSYYSGNRISSAYFKIKELLNKEDIPFEFLIIDDGSNDNSYELAIQLENEYPDVKAFQLSRNYTSSYSIFAGLTLSSGNCFTVIPDDEQQPYSLLIDLYRLWERGEKVIFTQRANRDDPWFSKILSNLYYKAMNNLSVIEFPKGGTDTFLIDREIVDILNKRIHPINTSIITEILRLGFSPKFLEFNRPIGLNNGKSRWSFKKKVKLAKDTFYSSSSFPIKFISFIGIFFSVISFFLILFYVYIAIWGNKFFWKIEVRGWTSTILLISFFGGLILLSLGIIAEYIWRIYEEVKDRPGFIIKKKLQ